MQLANLPPCVWKFTNLWTSHQISFSKARSLFLLHFLLISLFTFLKCFYYFLKRENTHDFNFPPFNHYLFILFIERSGKWSVFFSLRIVYYTKQSGSQVKLKLWDIFFIIIEKLDGTRKKKRVEGKASQGSLRGQFTGVFGIEFFFFFY